MTRLLKELSICIARRNQWPELIFCKVTRVRFFKAWKLLIIPSSLLLICVKKIIVKIWLFCISKMPGSLKLFKKFIKKFRTLSFITWKTKSTLYVDKKLNLADIAWVSSVWCLVYSSYLFPLFFIKFLFFLQMIALQNI